MQKYFVCLVWVVMLISGAAIAQGEPSSSGDEAAIQAVIAELKQVYSTEIMMGKPVEVNGLKLIPLATVGFGYGQHEGQPGKEQAQGAGGVMIPVGVVVVSDKDVRLIQLSKGFLEQLVDAFAPVILQVMQMKQTEGQESASIPGKGISVKTGVTQTRKSWTALYVRIVGFFFLGWLVVVLLLEAFIPRGVSAVMSSIRQNYLLSGLVGLVGYGVMFLLFAIFTVSLIGIPLSLVVLILTCVLTVFGTAGITLIVGRRIAETLKQTSCSDMFCVLIGGLIMGVLGVIPILGWIGWTIFGVLGFGAVVRGLPVNPAK
jgi:uncharacterized spore protein YtfJ